MIEKKEENINIEENEIIENKKQKISPKRLKKPDDKIVFFYIIIKL